MTNQPEWQCVGNIGDANPIAGGDDGKFVFVDKTGVYDPELEVWECLAPSKENSKWRRYLLILEPLYDWHGHLCSTCEKKYRPTNPHSEWFSDDIHSMAQSCGIERTELVAMLTSLDPVERAWGYGELISCLGIDNFDPYPDGFTEAEAEKRIDAYLGELEAVKHGQR